MTDLMIVVFSEETVSVVVVVTVAAVFVLPAAVVVAVAVVEGVAFADFVVQAESAQERGFGWECLSGN